MRGIQAGAGWNELRNREFYSWKVIPRLFVFVVFHVCREKALCNEAVGCCCRWLMAALNNQASATLYIHTNQASR